MDIRLELLLSVRKHEYTSCAKKMPTKKEAYLTFRAGIQCIFSWDFNLNKLWVHRKCQYFKFSNKSKLLRHLKNDVCRGNTSRRPSCLLHYEGSKGNILIICIFLLNWTDVKLMFKFEFSSKLKISIDKLLQNFQLHTVLIEQPCFLLAVYDLDKNGWNVVLISSIFDAHSVHTDFIFFFHLCFEWFAKQLLVNVLL